MKTRELNTLLKTSQVLTIVSEYYSPSTAATAQLIADLVAQLRQSGVRVIVLTHSFGDSRSNEPDIYRLGTSRTGQHISAFKKLISALLFLRLSLTWIIRNTSRDDKILLVSNPPFITIIGILVYLLRRQPYYFLLQDIFPRSASIAGILPAKGLLKQTWNWYMSLSIRLSKETIVLSDSMRQRCILDFGNGLPLTVIPNWAVESAPSNLPTYNPLREEWGLGSSFVIHYSGNFGRLHDMMTLLETARLSDHIPEIKYLFVGDGAKKEQIERYKNEYKLKNIILRPYIPRSKLPLSLSLGSLCVISLTPGAEDTVAPSKLYGVLASGKPILYIGSNDSEIAQFLRRYSCGISVETGCYQELLSNIIVLTQDTEKLALMGRNSRLAYQQNYSLKGSADLYYKTISC